MSLNCQNYPQLTTTTSTVVDECQPGQSEQQTLENQASSEPAELRNEGGRESLGHIVCISPKAFPETRENQASTSRPYKSPHLYFD